MATIFTPKSRVKLWDTLEGFIITPRNNINLIYCLEGLAILSQNLESSYIFSPINNKQLFYVERQSVTNMILYSPKSKTPLFKILNEGENFRVYSPKNDILLMYTQSDPNSSTGSYVFSPKNSKPIFYIEGLTFISGGHGNEGDDEFIVQPSQVCGVTTFSIFNQLNLNINNITSQNTQSPQNNRVLPCAGVIIHHTAGGSLSGAISTLRNNNLSYHYLIEANGQISQFTNNNIRGHHSGGQNRPTLNTWGTDPNSVTIGIAFVGNFVNGQPTQIALDNCANLIRSLVDNNVIVGNTNNNITSCVVAGHFCNQATSCPGNTDFGRFREFSLISSSLADDEEGDDVIYNKIEEVPKWARPIIQKYKDNGILHGDENGDLKLSLDMIRLIVIVERRFLIE